MNKTTTTLTLLLLGMSSAAMADSPCPPVTPVPPVKHKRIKRKPPVLVVPPTVEVIPCNCPPGKPGKDGHDGKDGNDGLNGFDGVTTIVGKPGLALRVGLMGVLQAPHADWAWGPALQLAQPVGTRGEFVVDVGAALPADGWIANEKGLMMHAGYARYFDKQSNIGLTLGVHGTSIKGSAANGGIGGDYLGGNVGFVIKGDRVRAEFGAVFGGLRDDAESGTQFATGIAGSMFVTL